MKKLLFALLFTTSIFAQNMNFSGTNADSFRISLLGKHIKWKNTSQRYFTSAGLDTTWLGGVGAADTSKSYNWTGLHNFKNDSIAFNNKWYVWPSAYKANSFLYDSLGNGVVKWKSISFFDSTKNQQINGVWNFHNSITKFRDVSYTFPTANPTYASVLKNNSAGVLTWEYLPRWTTVLNSDDVLDLTGASLAMFVPSFGGLEIASLYGGIDKQEVTLFNGSSVNEILFNPSNAFGLEPDFILEPYDAISLVYDSYSSGWVVRGTSAMSWRNLKGKPTTISGFGLTNAVTAPATNSDNYIPLWSGANSKTLSNGLAYDANATASTIVSRNSSGNSYFNDVLLRQLHLGTSSVFSGQILFYHADNSDIAYLKAPASLTASRSIYLPDKDGTVALTSDILTASYAEAYFNGTSDIGYDDDFLDFDSLSMADSSNISRYTGSGRWELKVTNAGRYSVTYSATAIVGVGMTLDASIQGYLLKNNVAIPNNRSYAAAQINTSGIEQTITKTVIVNLAANDTIHLALGYTDAATVSWKTVTISMYRISN